MHTALMRFIGIVNVVLGVGLVVVAMYLYGREHEVRQVERQIRKLEQATQLEKDAIRRLAIEWESLRNPMRLEPLARLKLNLAPPDVLAVRTESAALNMLPLRPPAAEAGEVAPTDRDALSALAAQVSGAGAAAAAGRVEEAPLADATAGDPQEASGALTGLIRQTLPGGER